MKVQKGNALMFYLSAALAILGAVAYQYFVRRVPSTLNPIVSIIGIYVSVLVLSAILLPFFPAAGGLPRQFQRLGWIQLAIAGSVLLIELGYLLMYRSGWNLNSGNLVTGVVINTALLGLGLALFGEKINAPNILGIVLSLVGVALISYHP